MKSSSIKSNIHCYCRLKKDEMSGNSIKIIDNNLIRLTNLSTKAQSNYFFDRVFNYKISQHDVFQEFEPLISEVLNGTKAVIFNFGETNSGKTYTQYGPNNNPGIIFRLLQRLMEGSKTLPCKLKISMIEVLDNSVYDLLTQTYKKIHINNDISGFQKISSKELFSSLDLLNAIELGKRNRPLDESEVNPEGTVVLTLSIEIYESKEYIKRGVFQFIDLGGSEFINYNIPPNKVQLTLNTLQKAVQSIDNREIQISPNKNLLFEYLIDTVQCNSQILLIYNIDPSIDHMIETQKTLQFHFDSRKEFNYIHLIEYLEKENNNFQQLVSTLRLENEMLLRQINTNTSNLSMSSNNHPSIRLNSIDRINPSTPTFVPHVTRRTNSVSALSNYSNLSRYSSRSSIKSQLPSVLEIKQSINKEKRRIYQSSESVKDERPMFGLQSPMQIQKKLFINSFRTPNSQTQQFDSPNKSKIIKSKATQSNRKATNFKLMLSSPSRKHVPTNNDVVPSTINKVQAMQRKVLISKKSIGILKRN